ncbi:helix-turn-helix domain-containing protein [Candidatus Bipolaricaulota bacterium]|nr:helix-turn-helix domain-containing protein [Candidatus Bipolaricaulota bacterium]
MDLEKLGRKIREVRNSRGLTLEDLSDQLNVAQSYLSEVERGKKVPSLKVLCSLSAYLDLPRSFLREVLEEPEGKVKSLGEMIATRRMELGMSPEDLSRVTGWPRSYLEEAEFESSTVPPELFQDLVKALEFPDVFCEQSATKAIGGKLKFFRQSSDLTQTQLAEKTELSSSLISKIERGEVQPSLPTLAKLSKSLGISPCCFVFQLSHPSSDLEGVECKNAGESKSERVLRIRKIISHLTELDDKELEILYDYLVELKK